MAKARSRSVRSSRPASRSATRCGCNPGWLLVAVILLTLGIYGVVGGFREQLNGYAQVSTVLLWYFVGIVLIMMGKMAKYKSHQMCTLHP